MLIQALPYAAALLLSLFSVLPEGVRLPWASKKGVRPETVSASTRTPIIP
jgi:hypothetical protein